MKVKKPRRHQQPKNQEKGITQCLLGDDGGIRRGSVRSDNKSKLRLFCFKQFYFIKSHQTPIKQVSPMKPFDR